MKNSARDAAFHETAGAALFLILRADTPADEETRARDCADRKRLIVHADDFGLCPSVNEATITALENGAITSASLMAPCEYFQPAAEYAARHPEMDLGIHLTVTSEWKAHRWGPVAERREVESLVDDDGCFWPEADRVAGQARLEEVYIELKSQVEKVLATRMKPTHIDTHMFALFYNEGLYSAYRAVAQEYGLPFLVPSGPSFSIGAARRDKMLVHTLLTARPEIPAAKWTSAYVRSLESLHGGVTQVNVHLGFDCPDLRRITGEDTPWGSTWRQRDSDVVASGEFQEALRSAGIERTRWRELVGA